ncbi:MAG: Npun_F0813 family protein, partial [Cyanobacteria bacterium J06627_15]
MFILKRQDVEISSFQHPTKEQKIPILSYQGQTFRLLSVFSASQEEEARALWRELTDNRGKACVLLEEPDRFSVWGKIRLDMSKTAPVASPTSTPTAFVQASVLILQALYEDVEDLMGSKQAKQFEQDITTLGSQWKLPQAGSPQAVHALLQLDPFAGQLPAWQENHLNFLLKELHQLGKAYFGLSNFEARTLEAIDELPSPERTTFLNWLKRS